MCHRPTEIERKLERLEERLKELEEREALVSPAVAFSVAAVDGRAAGDDDATVRFNTVMSNVGDAYNLSTGVFTAPFDGLYFFTFFYQTPGGQGKRNRSGPILYKNDQELVTVSADQACDGGTSSAENAVMLQLRADDEVRLALPGGYATWAAGRQVSVSGFLLQGSPV